QNSRKQTSREVFQRSTRRHQRRSGCASQVAAKVQGKGKRYSQGGRMACREIRPRENSGGGRQIWRDGVGSGARGSCSRHYRETTFMACVEFSVGNFASVARGRPRAT